jgi:regulator of protease activity HflC (stomatin/prohibitin superfamily)
VATIIVEGEAKFRRSLREADGRAEQLRILEEKRRQEELARRNRERLEKLHESGELLRQAEAIRAVVAQLRQAMAHGAMDLDEAAVRSWEEWALAEADRIDPIRSGQVNTHLLP